MKVIKEGYTHPTIDYTKSKDEINLIKKKNKINKKIDINLDKFNSFNNKIGDSQIKIIPFKNFLNPSLGLPKKLDMNPLKIFEMLLKKPDNNIDEESNIVVKKDKYHFDPKIEYKELDLDIKSIDDLINLGKSYDKSINYPIDMKTLNNLVEPLIELKNTIGMQTIKKNIVKQLLYYLQDLNDDSNMMHTVITGPPGVGKTMLGIMLSKIYYNMGILKKTKDKFINPITGEKEDFKFNIVRRSDLIGEYVGHTAVKTQKAIEKSFGGVMFIDEAYSLGNKENKDIFSKECIDTINQNLTENKDKFICIIAGYKEEIEKCFFSYNEGLKRRFVFRYNVDKYTSRELAEIFFSKIDKSNWKFFDETNNLKTKVYDFFKENYKFFPNFGGDIELFILSCKLSHSMRIFGKSFTIRKKITFDDITEGLNLFLSHKASDKDKTPLLNMYL